MRQGWYEHPDTVAIFALGERRSEPPDNEALLIDTLTYALEIMETPRVYERAAGYAALVSSDYVNRTLRSHRGGDLTPAAAPVLLPGFASCVIGTARIRRDRFVSL